MVFFSSSGAVSPFFFCFFLDLPRKKCSGRFCQIIFRNCQVDTSKSSPPLSSTPLVRPPPPHSRCCTIRRTKNYMPRNHSDIATKSPTVDAILTAPPRTAHASPLPLAPPLLPNHNHRPPTPPHHPRHRPSLHQHAPTDQLQHHRKHIPPPNSRPLLQLPRPLPLPRPSRFASHTPPTTTNYTSRRPRLRFRPRPRNKMHQHPRPLRRHVRDVHRPADAR